MTTFFLDLWHDLREKRLWPVAAGLLAAALAIPVVMLKPASSGSAPTPVVAKPAQPATLPAVEVDSSPTHGSKLDTFSQRDPFKPMSDLKKPASTSTTSTPSSSSSSPAQSASATGGSGGSGGGGAGAGGSAPSPRTSTSSPVTTPSSPSSQSNTTTTTPVKWFRYTADISFGQEGALKTLKSVADFTLLPDDKTAAVVFMGVSNDAKSAIFFVADPAFTPAGEGECNDKQDCRFIKLGLDPKKNEETFTSLDGSVVYKLKLLKLNREYISANAAQGDTTGQQSPSKLGKDNAGSTIADASGSVLPRLLDLPAVGSQHAK